MTGRAGVPVGATSAVLTLTVAAPAGYGFLTAWPADLARPTVSSVNVSRAGVTVANTQIIPLSASGAVRVFTSTPAAVIVDVTGYFVPAPVEVAAGRFQPTAPIRLVDTRQPGGGGVLSAGETRTYNPAPRVGVAYSALAVNITMTGTTGLSYVTAWPGNQSQPGTSNVNADAAGENRAAFAIVPTSSTIKVFASAGTHVVVDIVGIFTDASAPVDEAGLFVPVAPSRWIDTRGSGGKFTAGETRTYTHPVTVPETGSVFGNVTMAEAAPGYLTTWRAGDVAPSTSTVNSSSVDSTIANGAILTLSAGRQMSVRASSSTFLIVDEFGWFISAPVIQPPATTTTGPGTTVPPFVGCNDLPIDAFNTWRTTEGVAPLTHSNKIYDSACKWALALVTTSQITYSYWDYFGPPGSLDDQDRSRQPATARAPTGPTSGVSQARHQVPRHSRSPPAKTWSPSAVVSRCRRTGTSADGAIRRVTTRLQ